MCSEQGLKGSGGREGEGAPSPVALDTRGAAGGSEGLGTSSLQSRGQPCRLQAEARASCSVPLGRFLSFIVIAVYI